MITAPFNFVPLSDKVFFPDWANDISHDIPFEDEESGSIDITITAKSPIFIRDHQNPEQFCSHNGEYYIPSSSIKGVVRNVLEIMSFSKMSLFDDDTYAVRDLSKADNFYMKEMQKDTYCGWLKKVGDNYIIEDCGEVGRIRHEEIDKALSVDFASKFKIRSFNAKNKNHKTSQYKYDLIGDKSKIISLSNPFKSKTNAKYDNRVFYNYEKGGKNIATLVLTGQPTPRKDSGKKGDGKGYEFLFFESKKDIIVDKKVIENFKFAYFDKRTTEPKESPDWGYWKEKLNNGDKVPVFFQKNGKNIAHFGLSYLYKLSYTNSVKDGIKEAHFDDRIDLAQAIFGYTNKEIALKGRVQFSHFKAISNIEELQVRTEILGTPRASYYPIYVRQNSTKFKTFMDSSFDISGWKRYPIHQGNATTVTENTGNENVGTTFRPLRDNIVFQGKLRYHNLKKCELGAILSALTFHNTDGCFHNIGMAKSLGYGKIDIQLNGIRDITSYLKAFELEIGSCIPNWSKSSQIKELLTMATQQQNSEGSRLKYMSLVEFANSKSSDKDYLRCYSELYNINAILPTSLISDKEVEELQAIQEKKELEAKIVQEKEAKEIEFQKELKNILDTDNIQIIQNFIDKYPDYKKIDEIKAKKEQIETSKKDNTHKEVNQKAHNNWELVQKKKGNQKQYQNELDKFIKKWRASKNNKGSEVVLELVEKAELEQK